MNKTKHNKYTKIVTWLALFSLVATMFTGLIIGTTASAKNKMSKDNEAKSDRQARKSAGRVSPDLKERGQRAKARELETEIAPAISEDYSKQKERDCHEHNQLPRQNDEKLKARRSQPV